MSKNVREMLARLESGQGTSEDVEFGMQLAADPQLLKKSLELENAPNPHGKTPTGKVTGGELEEPDEHVGNGKAKQVGATVLKSVDGADFADSELDDPDAPDAAAPKQPEVRKSVAAPDPLIPQPGDLFKSLHQDPYLEEVFDAVEPLQRVAAHYDLLASRMDTLTKSVNSIAKAVNVLARQAVAAPAAQAPAAQSAPAEAAGPYADLQKSIAAKLSQLAEQVTGLEEAVSSRPHSPHPLQKSASNQQPPVQEVSKTDAIRVLQKSLGSGNITNDEFARAARLLDYDKDYVGVVSKFDPAGARAAFGG